MFSERSGIATTAFVPVLKTCRQVVKIAPVIFKFIHFSHFPGLGQAFKVKIS